MATALFEGGRGIELLIHTNTRMYPEYEITITQLAAIRQTRIMKD